MGRWYYSRKATTNESCRLTMPYLRKSGLLLSGQATGEIAWTSSMTGKKTFAFLAVDVANDPHIRIFYAITDRKGNNADYNCEVSLLTTDCTFGGVRYWFACPYCDRRIGVLYLAPGDASFRCRHCNNLSYRSRNWTGIEAFGEISRQAERLQNQMKRWTYNGRPTKKAQRLHALQQKTGMLASQDFTRMERLRRLK